MEREKVFISVLKGADPGSARPVLATGEPAVVAATLRAVVETLTEPERGPLLRLVDCWEAERLRALQEELQVQPPRVIRLRAGSSPEGTAGDDSNE